MMGQFMTGAEPSAGLESTILCDKPMCGRECDFINCKSCCGVLTELTLNTSVYPALSAPLFQMSTLRFVQPADGTKPVWVTIRSLGDVRVSVLLRWAHIQHSRQPPALHHPHVAQCQGSVEKVLCFLQCLLLSTVPTMLTSQPTEWWHQLDTL